jgi:tetratricopeptide (TPR) repeat protein
MTSTLPPASAPDVPADAAALNRRAIARLMQGDPEGALADFRRCVELDPGYAEAWNNSGLVRQRLGRPAEALADFDRALALRPDYPEALNNRGQARQRAGDLAGAGADFDRALACAPGRFAASVLHNRAAVRQRLGDLAGALADFDRALEIDPGHAATYLNRGAARKEAGDLDGALADCNIALERVAPDLSAATYHHRGGVKVLLGDIAGALADYNAALALEPNNPVFHLSRGNARYHRRDPLALADYRTAFCLNAEAAAREAARFLADDVRRDAEGVLENCRKHLRISARDALAWARRGLTLLLLGRAAEAEADLEQARALQPGFRAWLEKVVALIEGRSAEGKTGTPMAPAASAG